MGNPILNSSTGENGHEKSPTGARMHMEGEENEEAM